MKKACCVRVIIFLVSCVLLFMFNSCNNKFSDVHDYADVDVPPQPIYIPSPVYPDSAKLLEQEGDVVIQAIVEIDSTIGYAEVDNSNGYLLLDNAALDAAYDALFEPAFNEGEPVECWIATSFSFQLE